MGMEGTRPEGGQIALRLNRRNYFPVSIGSGMWVPYSDVMGILKGPVMLQPLAFLRGTVSLISAAWSPSHQRLTFWS